MSDAGFDPHAERYRQELAQGLMLSGESSDYFLQGRLQRVAQLLDHTPQAVLDFGCGVGDAIPVLRQRFPKARLHGVDISTASLDLARRRHGTLATFDTPINLTNATFDLVYCNGVFHHIPPSERVAAMSTIAQALRPGGHFAFWDNSPWSPAARWVMSRIPFDQDAVMVWPVQARRLIEAQGLQVLRREYHFIFPRVLAWLRWSERWVRQVPLGAQYLYWARRPAA